MEDNLKQIIKRNSEKFYEGLYFYFEYNEMPDGSGFYLERRRDIDEEKWKAALREIGFTEDYFDDETDETYEEVETDSFISSLEEYYPVYDNWQYGASVMDVLDSFFRPDRVTAQS